jgi:hypothetical protein
MYLSIRVGTEIDGGSGAFCQGDSGGDGIDFVDGFGVAGYVVEKEIHRFGVSKVGGYFVKGRFYISEGSFRIFARLAVDFLDFGFGLRGRDETIIMGAFGWHLGMCRIILFGLQVSEPILGRDG